MKIMNYFKLMYDYENDKGMTYVNINEKSLFFNQHDLNSDKKLDVEKVYCKVYGENMGEYGYIPNNLAWLIVSEKVKQIIEKSDLDTCEFIQVIDENSENVIGYLVHCMNIVSALDEKKSLCKKFEYISNGKKCERLSVIKYALIGEKVKGMNIFKLTESKSPYFISGKLRDSILESKAMGFDFLKVKTS